MLKGKEGSGLTIEELRETCRALPQSNSPWTWLWCKVFLPSSQTHHWLLQPLTENSRCWWRSSCSATNNIDSQFQQEKRKRENVRSMWRGKQGGYMCGSQFESHQLSQQKHNFFHYTDFIVPCPVPSEQNIVVLFHTP